MQQLRLFGLVLFITTIFLAMAAAATQTTHIRFKQPTRDANGNINLDWQRDDQVPGATTSTGATSPDSGSLLQFTSIPVIYPLLIAGGIGLLLWFVPAQLTASKPARRKRSSLSRRRRK